MLARLEATLQAAQTVRPPLEKFYNSLSDEQKERFNQLGPKDTTANAPRTPGRDGEAPAGDGGRGTVKPALESFYASLTSEQKARFNRIGRSLAGASGQSIN